MIKLTGRYYLDEIPKNAEKHPMIYKKLKNGKFSAYAEFFIPNGFILDALQIDDEEIKQKLMQWFTDTMTELQEQREQQK